MTQKMGVPASPSGHSRAEPEEVSALRASVPNAERLSAHVWADHFAHKEDDPSRCRAAVADGGRSPMFHQCRRKPIVFRDCTNPVGKFGFCKAHDPVAVAEKRAAQEAKWRSEWDEQDARIEARRKMLDAEKACIGVLREIASGHSDPRSAARQALAALDASAIEARSDATPKSDAAEGESATAASGDAQPLSPHPKGQARSNKSRPVT